jgi:hypothetical protein
MNRYLSFPIALVLASWVACSAKGSNDLPTSEASSGSSGGGVASTAGSAAVLAGTSSSGAGVSGQVGTTAPGGAAAGIGGAAGSAGAPASAGGSGSGGTGTSGAAGTSGSATCSGIPIVPDAGGYVSAASNTLGINGSWFYYSDCVDQKGVNCATQLTPAKGAMFPNVGGKMCTSGMTSTATGAWGAGLGFELNDSKGQQPYDTVAHGVKGFCVNLSGSTIPAGTGVRVAFTTKNNPDNAHFLAFTTVGAHPVLFSQIAQGSWVTTKTPFDAAQVMLLQLQIPSSPTAPVAWDFCVDQLTAITQ